MLHIKVNTLTQAKRDLVDTLTRSLAMELSGESNVETMRGNEISTTDKVHWYLSSLRSDRKRATGNN